MIYPRCIKVKVEHYLFFFIFSPPKISYTIWGIKYIWLHLFSVFYLIQPSSKQIPSFDFGKQNSVLPTVFYVDPSVSWANFCLLFLLRGCHQHFKGRAIIVLSTKKQRISALKSCSNCFHTKRCWSNWHFALRLYHAALLIKRPSWQLFGWNFRHLAT